MSKKVFSILLSFGILFLFFTLTGFSEKGEKHSEVDFSLSCVECHQEVTPEITKDWQAGKHGIFKVGCFVCHGDGQERFSTKPTTESCVMCHSDYESDLSNTKATNCFDCHNGHKLKFH